MKKKFFYENKNIYLFMILEKWRTTKQYIFVYYLSVPNRHEIFFVFVFVYHTIYKKKDYLSSYAFWVIRGGEIALFVFVCLCFFYIKIARTLLACYCKLEASRRVRKNSFVKMLTFFLLLLRIVLDWVAFFLFFFSVCRHISWWMMGMVW